MLVCYMAPLTYKNEKFVVWEPIDSGPAEEDDREHGAGEETEDSARPPAAGAAEAPEGGGRPADSRPQLVRPGQREAAQRPAHGGSLAQ